MPLEAIALLKIVGFTAVGVLVLGWLVVSFASPGPRRTVVEWVSALAMYVALLCLFLSLLLRAWDATNWFAVVAFGFLATVFLGGLGVALVMTAREIAGRSGGGPVDATH